MLSNLVAFFFIKSEDGIEMVLKDSDQFECAQDVFAIAFLGIGEIEDTCRFEKIEIRGYRNPSALREYTRAPSCSHFIDALEGKSDIMTLFRETLRQDCSRNGSPATCEGRYLSDAQKPNGMEWVRLYLTGYGWHNCANEFTTRNADSTSLAQMREDLENQFRRLFKIVRDRCEAPGR